MTALEQRYLHLQGQTAHDPKGVFAGLQDLLHELQQAQQEPVLQARVLCALGGCCYAQGDMQGTLEFNEQALERLKLQGDANVEAAVRNGLGIAKQRLGFNEEALDEFLSGLRLSEQLGLVERRAQTLINIATCHHHLGNHELALNLQREALAYAQLQEYQPAITYAQLNLIAILNALQRYEEALEHGPDTLTRLQALGDLPSQMELQRDLSAAELALGRPAQAKQAAQVGLSLLTPQRPELNDLIEKQGDLLVSLARALQAAGEDLQAEAHLRQADALLQGRELLQLEAQVQQEFTALFEKRQDYVQAFKHGKRHLEIERELTEFKLRSRTTSLHAQAKVRALQREAELERQRRAELAEKHQALLDAQEQLTYRATHDSLTGISNRAHFLHGVQDTLNSLSSGEHAALLFIDLDQFKSVNDLFSHAVGDELLQQVAARLQQAVPPPDVVGRVGGDEFNVLYTRVTSRDAALDRARQLLAVLREPYQLRGRPLEVTASIGCAVAPEDGQDAGTLQSHADLAMFNIKHMLRNNVLMYSPEIRLEHERRLNLERDLRGAQQRGELELYYQGRFTVQEQRLEGFEALIRWFHPQRGMITPKSFIPLAENTGLILPIGAWVLHEACQQAVIWEFEQRGLSISVNVSPLQFEQPDFVQHVQEVLNQTGLPGRCLVLELTETLVLRDMHLAQQHIEQAQALGIRVAIDDFGTGYSSLSVLHDLPFNHLKIDQTFMHRIQDNTEFPVISGVLMDGMVNLAHDLTMQVTAEGLENPQQLLYLRDLNCDFAQGYLLGEPQPASEAAKLLSAAFN